jgi:hypothetical protein
MKMKKYLLAIQANNKMSKKNLMSKYFKSLEVSRLKNKKIKYLNKMTKTLVKFKRKISLMTSQFYCLMRKIK